MTLGRVHLVFIHGFAGNAGHWAEVCRRLPSDNCKTTIDLAAHGSRASADGPYTIERCARDVVDRLPRRPSVLVGHSMGTRIALEAALLAPERVRSLVLVDGSNAPGDPVIIEQQMRQEIARRGLAATMTSIVEGFLIAGLPPERRLAILQQALELPDDAVIDYWSSMGAWDDVRFQQCVDQINRPIVVLQSTSLAENAEAGRFRFNDLPNSRWLDIWRRSGNAEIEGVPDCGHYLMIEHPGTVVKAVTAAAHKLELSADRALL